MAGKNTAVFGIYKTQAAIEEAVDQLKAAGYRNTDISALFPENVGTKDFAHEKNTKAPEGATTGAGTGAVLGGTLGWLAGIGALAIPGLGPFIAAGPIMGALSGAAVGGATGGLIGALIGLGIPELEAKQYEGKVRAGNILISVHTQDSKERSRAKDIFEKFAATDVSSTGEASVPKDARAPDRVVTKDFSGEVTRGAGEMRVPPVVEIDDSIEPTVSVAERDAAPAPSTRTVR